MSFSMAIRKHSASLLTSAQPKWRSKSNPVLLQPLLTLWKTTTHSAWTRALIPAFIGFNPFCFKFAWGTARASWNACQSYKKSWRLSGTSVLRNGLPSGMPKRFEIFSYRSQTCTSKTHYRFPRKCGALKVKRMYFHRTNYPIEFGRESIKYWGSLYREPEGVEWHQSSEAELDGAVQCIRTIFDSVSTDIKSDNPADYKALVNKRALMAGNLLCGMAILQSDQSLASQDNLSADNTAKIRWINTGQLRVNEMSDINSIRAQAQGLLLDIPADFPIDILKDYVKYLSLAAVDMQIDRNKMERRIGSLKLLIKSEKAPGAKKAHIRVSHLKKGMLLHLKRLFFLSHYSRKSDFKVQTIDVLKHLSLTPFPELRVFVHSRLDHIVRAHRFFKRDLASFYLGQLGASDQKTPEEVEALLLNVKRPPLLSHSFKNWSNMLQFIKAHISVQSVEKVCLRSVIRFKLTSRAPLKCLFVEICSKSSWNILSPARQLNWPRLLLIDSFRS